MSRLIALEKRLIGRFASGHRQRLAVGQSHAQSLTVFRTQVRLGYRWHDKTVAHQGL
jgi:hypothetical protein